jgi:hypothetical protein
MRPKNRNKMLKFGKASIYGEGQLTVNYQQAIGSKIV